MRPGDGRKAAFRILSVDPALYSMPVYLNIVLPERQFLAAGYQYLLFDKIDARHQLRYRVLDLDSGIHLHKIIIFVGIDKELYRARAFLYPQAFAAFTARRMPISRR
jgi:hypothetical protein